VLTPGQIELICDACTVWHADAQEWRGTTRDRLLWSVLAETGMRLGEALRLQHRDWHTGRGDTPFIRDRGRRDAYGRAVEGVHRRLAHRERRRRDRGPVVNRQRSAATPGSADTPLSAALSALWETVPAGMRLTYVSRYSVPAQYRDGLGQRRDRALGMDLSGLPEPMRKELAWCIYRIIELGGKVDVTHARMLARRIADTVSDLAVRAPQSLTELSTHDWQRQMALSVRRRTGSLPGAATARDMREQLGRCHRLLSPAYDTRPWWLRDVWAPSLDSRIPQRAHEGSRAAGTASTSIASAPAGFAAARSGTARSVWKPVPCRGERRSCESTRWWTSTSSSPAETCPARGWLTSRPRSGC
jgi:hypothetical protein